MRDSVVESLGRVRAKGIALLAITFLAGAAAGLAGSRILSPRLPSMAMPFPGGPMAAEARDNPMFAGLGLSEDQIRRIDSIFATSRPRIDALMGERQARMRDVIDSVRTGIRQILTPDQQARMEARMSRFPNRFGPRSLPGPP